jgi:hypothetical protein
MADAGPLMAPTPSMQYVLLLLLLLLLLLTMRHAAC